MPIFKRLLCAVLSIISTLAIAEEASPSFYVIHFETGPQWVVDMAPAEQAGFAEHSANLSQLRKDGVISFGARYGNYGMIIIEAVSLDSAIALIDEDPGVKAGIFDYSIAPLNVFYPWQE